MKLALEGVESIERLTQKQREYVLKVSIIFLYILIRSF